MIYGETEPSMDGRADGERQRGDLGKRKRTRRSGQGCRAKIIIEIRRRVEVFGLCKAERVSEAVVALLQTRACFAATELALLGCGDAQSQLGSVQDLSLDLGGDTSLTRPSMTSPRKRRGV